MRLGAAQLCYFLCFAEWLELIVHWRVTIHPMTKPHNPCPQGEEFSCPNIRVNVWLISQVRSWWTFPEWQQNDWKNNCCPLLLNTSGVAVLCVFPKGVTLLLLFSNLLGEVVGGMACFFRVSCQTLRFIVWCKAWNVLFRMSPMMIPTRFRFPWRRVLASGVEFPCPSYEGDSWGVVWCKICGTEIRVKFIGWSWSNESVCDATTFASA